MATQSKPEHLRILDTADLAADAIAANTHTEPTNSWMPVELYDLMTNPSPPVEPSILHRTDGLALFYPGKNHLVMSQPEGGKSQLATHAGTSEMNRQEGFAYIDFEDTAESFVERATAHGATTMQLGTQVYYVRPDAPLEEWSRGELLAAMRPEPSLIVIDANTEALSLHGLDSNNGNDWSKLMSLLVYPLRDTGAAVVLLDHVTKDRDSRGRFAIGTGHKLASVDVAYTLETIKPFGRGSEGSSRLKLVKDRPGHLRQHANDSGVIGIVNYIPGDNGALTVTIDPPDAASAAEFRPTHLMERASRHIEASPGDSTRSILEAVGGRRNAASLALRLLKDEGFVTVERQGSASLHTSVNPYREETDRYPTVTGGGDDLDF